MLTVAPEILKMAPLWSELLGASKMDWSPGPSMVSDFVISIELATEMVPDRLESKLIVSPLAALATQ